MDTAQVITLAATMLGFVAVLTALFALMWQMNSRYNRLNAKLDTAFGGLRKAWQEGVNSVLASQTRRR